MALLGTGWSLEVKTRMSYAKWFFSQLDKQTGIPFTLTQNRFHAVTHRTKSVYAVQPGLKVKILLFLSPEYWIAGYVHRIRDHDKGLKQFSRPHGKTTGSAAHLHRPCA